MEDAISQAQTLRRTLREIGNYMGSVLRAVENLQQGSPDPSDMQNLRVQCEEIAVAIQQNLKRPDRTVLRGDGRILIVGGERLRRSSGTILRRVGYEVVEVDTAANLPLEDGRPYGAVLISVAARDKVSRIRSRWPSAALIFTGPQPELTRVAEEEDECWQLPDHSSYLSLAAVVADALVSQNTADARF